MTCPKCYSENVSVQMVTEQKLERKRHGFLYGLLFWWVGIFKFFWNALLFLIKWFCFTIPALILMVFRIKPHKQKPDYTLKTKHYSMCVCQDCGYHWKA